MKIRRYNPTLAITALAAGLVAGANAVHAQIPCGYEVQVIQGPWCGELFGYPPTVAKGISESGTIVGYYTSCLIGPSEAFIWTEDAGLITLERPQGYTDASAEDIDSTTGWIVGSMQPQGTNRKTAALWIDGQATDLGTLPGGNYSHAFAIDNGRIVGKWGNNIIGDPAIGAFLYQNGRMFNIHADLGTPNSWAWDVNAAGQVTGWMGCAPQTNARAFIWDAGRVTELPPIPGGFTSEGHAITSDSSTIAGVGRWIDRKTGDDFPRAFLWHNGKMTNLGTLLGFTRSGAGDLTEATLVIGAATAPGAVSAGFIWYQDLMVDVNTLIDANTSVEVTACSAINSQGQIAAVGHDAKGDVVALLLTPRAGPLGDLNGDCTVGASDLLILLTSWGACRDCADCPADLDGNCVVGASDLLLLLVNWG